MAWWNASGALTAVVAHDALNAGGGGSAGGVAFDLSGGSTNMLLKNFIGTAPLVSLGYDAALTGLYYGIYGQGGTCPYTAAVTLPVSGAAFVLVRQEASGGQNAPWLADAAGTTNYMLYLNSQKLTMGDAFTTGTPTIAVGHAWHALGVFWDATNYQLYHNNALYGAARMFTAGIRPMTINGMVSTLNGSFTTNGLLAASGMFSGTGTLAALQSIESAARAELAVPSARNYFALTAPVATRHTLADRETGVPSVGLKYAGLSQPLSATKAFQSRGLVTLMGTVTIETVPASRKVFLFDKKSKQILEETVSTPTGYYQFTNLQPGREYFVWGEDGYLVWDAVTHDRLVPT